MRLPNRRKRVRTRGWGGGGGVNGANYAFVWKEEEEDVKKNPCKITVGENVSGRCGGWVFIAINKLHGEGRGEEFLYSVGVGANLRRGRARVSRPKVFHPLHTLTFPFSPAHPPACCWPISIPSCEMHSYRDIVIRTLFMCLRATARTWLIRYRMSEAESKKRARNRRFHLPQSIYSIYSAVSQIVRFVRVKLYARSFGGSDRVHFVWWIESTFNHYMAVHSTRIVHVLKCRLVIHRVARFPSFFFLLIQFEFNVWGDPPRRYSGGGKERFWKYSKMLSQNLIRFDPDLHLSNTALIVWWRFDQNAKRTNVTLEKEYFKTKENIKTYLVSCSFYINYQSPQYLCVQH